MTQEITTLPNEPFYEGSENVTGDDQFHLPVSINGRGFIVDRSQQYAQFSRRSLNLTASQQSESSADDASVPPEVWRRAVISWHQGEDQERYDRKDGMPYKFHRSRGVEVFNEYNISLLNRTQMVQALDSERSWVVTVGAGKLAVVNNLKVYYWNTPSGAIGAPSGNLTLPSKAVSVTTDGYFLYILCADAVVRRIDPSGLTVTTFATIPGFDATRPLIAYVKGFLLAAGAHILYDITSGTAETIYVHPLSNYIWRAACDGMATGYILGGIGDKWNVHALTINETATSFTPPRVAASLPEGEIGYTIGSYLGYILIGANTGWRFAIPDASGSLTFGQLVVTAAPVLCFEGQDRFVWFGLTTADSTVPFNVAPTDPRLTTEVAMLGKADLSTFVAPLTPAAAADLESPVNGIVWSVTTFGATSQERGWRVFCVGGSGVYVERDELIAEGWLTQGEMTFGSSDPKIGLYSQVYYDALPGGTVAVDASYDDSAFVEIGKSSTVGSTSLGNMPMNQKFDHAAEIRYRLLRDPVDLTLGPNLNRLEFRAMNVPGKSTEWSIPLLLADDLGYEGVAEDRNVESDYDLLVGLVERRVQFAYREGQRKWDLYATDFTWMPTHLTADGGTFQGVFVLQAKEIR